MGIFFAFSAVAVSTASPISGNILAMHGWLGLAGERLKQIVAAGQDKQNSEGHAGLLRRGLLFADSSVWRFAWFT